MVMQDEEHVHLHEEMDKISEEFSKFNEQLTTLYNEAEQNPQKVISKTDSLLLQNEGEKGKYKSQIKKNIASSLHYLQAELYYRTGNYTQSINELKKEKYSSGEYATALAANYVKLHDFDTAKSYIDKIGPGFYIYDYALANYFEAKGNKTEALALYTSIKENKEIKHYTYYSWAVTRLEELSKSEPALLNEIYFPTHNPNFEIAASDDKNRNKIFEMVFAMPESKGKAVSIFESPQINDKDYYWIKVGDQTGFQLEDFKSDFSLFIYPKNFDIKYYDEKNNKLMTIEEWRKSK